MTSAVSSRESRELTDASLVSIGCVAARFLIGVFGEGMGTKYSYSLYRQVRSPLSPSHPGALNLPDFRHQLPYKPTPWAIAGTPDRDRVGSYAPPHRASVIVRVDPAARPL